jgi:anti-sigma regulatory factor (Ser/Thr protein kinase)
MSSRELKFAPDGAMLREVRSKVRELASSLGASESVCDSLALVVDELVNNAIEHGATYRREGDELKLSFTANGDRLEVEFFDPEMPADQVQVLAEALAETSNGMPSLDSERGRGLFLLSVYLEDLLAEMATSGGLRLFGSIHCK